MSDIASDGFNFFGPRTPVPRAPQMTSPLGQLAAGAYNGAVAPAMDFMASPEGMALSAVPALGPLASRGLAALFAPLAFKNAAEATGRAKDAILDPNASLQDKVTPIADALSQGAMAVGASTHAIPAPNFGRLGIVPEGMAPEGFSPVTTAQPPEGHVSVFRTIPKKYPYQEVQPGDWVSRDNPSGHDYQYEYAGPDWRDTTHTPAAFVRPEDLQDMQTGFGRDQTLVIRDGAKVIPVSSLFAPEAPAAPTGGPTQAVLDAMKAKLPPTSSRVDVLERDPETGEHSYQLDLKDAGGNSIGGIEGVFDPEERRLWVENSYLKDEGNIGKGYGQAMYRDLAKYAQQLGATAIDGYANDAAQRVRGKLFETFPNVGNTTTSVIPAGMRYMAPAALGLGALMTGALSQGNGQQ